MNTYQFHVTGMRCPSCVAQVESVLAAEAGVKSASVSLADQRVELVGDFGDRSPEAVVAELTKSLNDLGYALAVEKIKSRVKWGDFRVAVPLAVGMIAVFIGLQSMGMANWVTPGSHVSYSTAFLVGVIASLSSCMAIVGGLVLSISANYAKGGQAIWPQVMFHAGRLASFFLLGGVIGAAGSVFRFNDQGMLAMQAFVAVTMFILGLNLLDIFPWAKKLQPSLPAFLGKRVNELKTMNYVATPLLIGAATFILPCGFTQAMQLYSITTGSFMTGALIMSTFALGTLPVLAMVSFSLFGAGAGSRSGMFYKTAGLLVIFFAALNFQNACVGAGLIPPIGFGGTNLGAGPGTFSGSRGFDAEAGEQVIEITAKGGYAPAASRARADKALLLRVKTNGTYDCSTAVRIAALGWSKNMGPNEVAEIHVSAQKAGTVLVGVCSMGMFDFKITFE